MNFEELRHRLRGAMTALVTPFADGAVDRTALRGLIEWQVEQGIAALVPCGTTGEAPTLSFDERVATMRVCVDAVAGRIPVIAGTGTNDTRSTIALTAAARAFGADAALIVTPYYSRPTQEGLFRHFQAVARQVDLPIVVYNVPARTGVDLTPATLERLAAIPSIIGIKDATGDLARPMAVNNQFGERLVQLSGHDATAFGFNTMGGSGTISVVSNVAPRLCVDMHDACGRGDVHAARAIHKTLRPLVAALELESNPVPVKYALHLLGLIRPDVRLPLVPVLPETAAAIEEALRAVAAFSPPQSRAA